jgi:hypothetical protein
MTFGSPAYLVIARAAKQTEAIQGNEHRAFGSGIASGRQDGARNDGKADESDIELGTKR